MAHRHRYICAANVRLYIYMYIRELKLLKVYESICVYAVVFGSQLMPMVWVTIVMYWYM